MAHLVIEQPNVPVMTVPLPEDDLRLGRAEDNDVMLLADEVSRHHAKIVRRGMQRVLLDLHSLNGTYVDGQRILERVLSHNDEIWFGSKCRLVFHADAPEQTPIEEAGLLDDANISIVTDIDKIREEINRAGNSLSMIGEKAAKDDTAKSATRVEHPSEEDLVAMSRAYRRLDALYRASRLIASEFDLAKRLSDVLDTAVEVMGAERGFIMLRDDFTGGLAVSVAREMGRELKASSPSMGIASRAAIRGEPVLMTDREKGRNLRGAREHHYAADRERHVRPAPRQGPSPGFDLRGYAQSGPAIHRRRP